MTLLTLAVSLVAYSTGLLDNQELALLDARFAVRGDQHPVRDLVVVGVDDVTFSDLGIRWPFPRRIHARVIDRLKADGARVIAYDVQFTEQSPGRPRPCPALGVEAAPDDCALVTATKSAGNLVFSTTEVDKAGHSNVLGGDDNLRLLHARAADTILPNDADGHVRKVPYAIQGLDSFAVATVERSTGRRVSPAVFTDRGKALIDLRGRPGTIPEIPLSRVLGGRFPPGYFRGKIVIVGAVAASLKDIFSVATGGTQQMSGPELQANAVDTVRRGAPLRTVSRSLDVLLIILLGLAVPLASIRFLPLKALLGALVAAGLFLIGVQVAFDGGRVITAVYPLVALAISAVGSLLVHYFTETRERQRTRLMFARFVPENVVNDVLARVDDDLRLGGVQRDGTVLFSDLRGFTSFAESLPVERVLEVLNRYLGEMSEAILDNGGTLVAYMGDGIMAVFGAPIEQPDHADRALAAAREMLGPRLKAFNDYIRDEGLGSGFRMGVGLNSGDVMSGNVGSQRRLEYTAIGDTTNTASRLEGMTKGTPHQIFVADSTRARLSREVPDLEFVDEFEVRGRKEKIRLWSIADSVLAAEGEGLVAS
ncbi:MAG: adenylate/guanylate cyclase domain-containing protein [Thermoleophilaceae bacterium]